MAFKPRPSTIKRQRERAQKERRKLKEERRMQRRADRTTPSDLPGGMSDPTLEGGPQPSEPRVEDRVEDRVDAPAVPS